MHIKFLSLILVCLALSPLVFAQEKRLATPGEQKKSYKDWLNKDVAYLITVAEKEAFLKLETDEERETFVENFWARRDPDPDTEENEFREEYYSRIAYTNEHLAIKTAIAILTPGWKTDRGKTYIMLGTPERIETGRGIFKDNANVRFEKWCYSAAADRSDLQLTFIDPSESKEFRFLNKGDEEILNIPPYFPSAACLVCYSGYAPYRTSGAVQMASLLPYSIWQKLEDTRVDKLRKSPGETFSKRKTFRYRFRPSLTIVPTLTLGRKYMAVSLSARRKDLLFEDYSGSLVSKLDYFLRITKEDGKTDGIYAGRTQILRAATDMNEAKTDDVFKVLLDLPSGDYQIGAIARWGDGLWESGIGAASQKVTVR